MTAIMRTLRTRYVPIFAVLLAALMILCPLISTRSEIPPAACYVPGSDEESVRVTEKLAALGYVTVSSADELLTGVSRGRYDCGVILSDDLGGRIRAGETESLGTFVSSPLSAKPDLSRDAAAAILYAEAAPYLSAAFLDGTGTTADDVNEHYRAMMDEGHRFTLDLVTVDGAEIPESGKIALVRGALALLVFAAAMFSASRMRASNASSLADRVGVRAVVFRVLLPETLIRALLWIIGALVGLGIARLFGLSTDVPLYAAALYILAVTFFGVIAACLLGRILPLVTFFAVLASLAVCPIYTDLTLTLAWMRPLRLLFPPYWLWFAADHPLWAAVGAVILAAITGAVLVWDLRRRAK